MALLIVVCGGDDQTTVLPSAPGNDSGDQSSDTETDPSGDTDGQSSNPAPEPEPSGPVELNTIRIGSEVWGRTLPMTTGQCEIHEDDGNLPTSAFVWGTLDGDDDLRFAASLNQDGTVEAEISNGAMYWIAGERGPGDNDLIIELDFDTQTISGTATFTLINTGEMASGSFEFRCEK
jgi:hypothetical protein